MADSENLTITTERVRQAAASCPDAKRVLETLFPGAFQPAVPVLAFVENGATMDGLIIMYVRADGEWAGRAFWLESHGYNWRLQEDNRGALCLIPTRKESSK